MLPTLSKSLVVAGDEVTREIASSPASLSLVRRSFCFGD
jgi:hypothetical protein